MFKRKILLLLAIFSIALYPYRLAKGHDFHLNQDDSESDSSEEIKTAKTATSRFSPSKRSSKLVGYSECTHSPKAVCSSLNKACRCQIPLLCADKYWMQHRLQMSTHSADCLNCQRVLSDIHLRKADAVKSVQFSEVLLQHVTQLIALRNISEGGVSPAVLCHLAGLCSGDLEHFQTNGVEQSNMAMAIWYRAGQLLRQNSNLDLTALSNALLAECTSQPSCEQLVLHFLPFIYKEYRWYLTRQHEFADGNSLAVSAQIPLTRFGLGDTSKISPVFCDVCVTTLSYTKSALLHNGTLEAARKVVKGLCWLAGPKTRPKCEKYVDDHIESWVEDVEHNMNVPEICTKIGLCTPDQQTVLPSEGDNQHGIVCEKCEAFVNGLRRNVICRIKKVFNFVIPNLCRFFGRFEDYCLRETFNIKEKLIDSIEAILSTSVICRRYCSDEQTIGQVFSEETVVSDIASSFCGNGATDKCKTDVSKMLAKLLSEFTHQGSLLGCSEQHNTLVGDNCKVCMFVSRALRQLIPDSNDEQSVNDALDGVCRKINPDNISKKSCQQFVDNFRKTIIALITKRDVSLRALCRSLGVCIPQSHHQSLICGDVAIPSQYRMSPCELCRFSVSLLEHQLALNRTEEQISHWLQVQCKHLPSAFHEKCISMVQQNLPRMIELFNLLADPDLVCQALHLCSSMTASHGSVEEAIEELDQPLLPAESDYSKCNMCQMAAIAFKGWLEMTHGVDYLTNAMNSTCVSLFDGERRLDCFDAVKSIHRLLGHLVGVFDPLEFCRTAKFCPKSLVESFALKY